MRLVFSPLEEGSRARLSVNLTRKLCYYCFVNVTVPMPLNVPVIVRLLASTVPEKLGPFGICAVNATAPLNTLNVPLTSTTWVA